MKTLTILFESPNVFYAVIDGVNVRIDNPDLFEQSANTPFCSEYDELQAKSIWYKSYDGAFFKDPNDQLKPGDIFQVEGFEYEVNNCACNDPDWVVGCEYPLCKKAILKLAKEEEPKEQNDYLKITKLETSYGDVKELPDCLVKDMYDAAFYWSKGQHPNQKYRGNNGSKYFESIVRAAEIAIKYIEKLKK